jgi:hypothetical protein
VRSRNRIAEKLIRGSRSGSPVTYTTSLQGEEMLARILATPRRPHGRGRRRIFGIVAAVAAGLFLAGGATAAIGAYYAPTAPLDALPSNGDAFVCATAGMQRMGEAVARPGETPAQACGGAWEQMFGTQAPTELYSCVQPLRADPSPGGTESASPGWGGLVYVLDGQEFKNAPETCGSVGMLVAPLGD